MRNSIITLRIFGKPKLFIPSVYRTQTLQDDISDHTILNRLIHQMYSGMRGLVLITTRNNFYLTNTHYIANDMLTFYTKHFIVTEAYTTLIKITSIL